MKTTRADLKNGILSKGKDAEADGSAEAERARRTTPDGRALRDTHAVAGRDQMATHDKTASLFGQDRSRRSQQDPGPVLHFRHPEETWDSLSLPI